MLSIRDFRLRCALLLPAALLVTAGCEQPTPPPPQPPEVVVAKPIQRDVRVYADFTGNTAAISHVEIRARVQGVLEKEHYEPGSLVKAGQLLFEIEREPFVAARDQAEADVQASEAYVRRAQSDLERLEQAVKTNAVSQQEVTRARAERDQAQAGLLAARARLDTAEIDLEYTTMHSPIDGIVTRTWRAGGHCDRAELAATLEHCSLLRAKGTLATADGTLLVHLAGDRVELTPIADRALDALVLIGSSEAEVSAAVHALDGLVGS